MSCLAARSERRHDPRGLWIRAARPVRYRTQHSNRNSVEMLPTLSD